MTSWQIQLTATAVRSLKRLSRADQIRVREAIDGLPDGDVKKLTAKPGQFRLRIGGMRIVFVPDLQARQIIILDTFHRGREYR